MSTLYHNSMMLYSKHAQKLLEKGFIQGEAIQCPIKDLQKEQILAHRTVHIEYNLGGWSEVLKILSIGDGFNKITVCANSQNWQSLWFLLRKKEIIQQRLHFVFLDAHRASIPNKTKQIASYYQANSHIVRACSYPSIIGKGSKAPFIYVGASKKTWEELKQKVSKSTASKLNSNDCIRISSKLDLLTEEILTSSPTPILAAYMLKKMIDNFDDES